MKKSLLALASGTLGLGIAEFVMMGILPRVAHDLNISIPEAGHCISAYAIGVCVGAPLTVLIARTRPLKQILLGLAALYIFGNLCAALSPNYWMLLLMRFVSGLPHGAFFGVGSIVAEKVADKGKKFAGSGIDGVGYDDCQSFGCTFGYVAEYAVFLEGPLPVQYMLGTTGVLFGVEMDSFAAGLARYRTEGTVPFPA